MVVICKQRELEEPTNCQMAIVPIWI